MAVKPSRMFPPPPLIIPYGGFSPVRSELFASREEISPSAFSGFRHFPSFGFVSDFGFPALPGRVPLWRCRAVSLVAYVNRPAEPGLPKLEIFPPS